MTERDCKCCQRAIALNNDGYHCKYCWDKWHNGERDKDFIIYEEWLKLQKDFNKDTVILKKIMDNNKELLERLSKK